MKPNAMLVTLVPDSSDFVTLQTYDPVHGKSQRFYVSHPDLTGLCTADMPLMDTDLNNYLIARNYKGILNEMLLTIFLFQTNLGCSFNIAVRLREL